MARSILPVGIAFIGGILTAAGVMLIPVGMLESAIGTTGLAEIIPAAAPPLGGTARVLLAFGTGVLTIAMLTLGLLQFNWGAKPRPFAERHAGRDTGLARQPAAAPSQPAAPSAGIGAMISGIFAGIARRARGHGIAELSDLPKLRSADRHPDAPPRRPINANADLGEPFDGPVRAVSIAPEPIIEAAPEEPAPVLAESAVEILPPVQDAPPAPAAAAPVAIQVESAAPTPRPVPPPAQPEPVRHRPLPRMPLDEVAGEPRRPTRRDIAQIIARREATEERLPELLDRLDRAVARSRTRAADPQSDPRASSDLPSPPPLAAVGGTASIDDRRMDDALRAALKSLGRTSAVR